ncbi:hypothetical protein F511_33617 [Dorcoceras hygrometricum]|uniref:E3 UFM1-protein ligase 1 n=1 Tax=Dorcoceras hygrometricum TaxID=472368 RepID=A0A2Z7BVJ8_9LAMI|nr:hypothetical protein F511_33617 [Dorcoceras hygrometricum]
MDEELLALQRQFEFAQQAKSSIRLSDRNVVELVQKLQQLQIIDFDLFHTTSGKEYITPEQLRNEILSEIIKRGRVSLIDLADTTAVDLYHVERQSQHAVSNDSSLMLINGEIFSSGYWDTVSEEINERLQECSQISLAEIAEQLQVGSELLVSVLEPRLGSLVKGRLEGGQLYTPAYVARVNAMVRGAARGITVPMNLTGLWSSLQVLLHDMNGSSGVAVESSFFQSLFNSLVKEGEILGSLRAGVNWTPSVFAMAQKEYVDAFFSQNSFISYEALQKLGIPQPIQLLQSGKALMLGDSYFFSESFVMGLFNRIERDMETFHVSGLTTTGLSEDSQPVKDSKHGRNDVSNLPDPDDYDSQSGISKPIPEKGSKKKKGKSMGNVKAGGTETVPEFQESAATKSKKNQKKGKVIPALQLDSKSGSKKESNRTDNPSFLSEESVIQKLEELIPDLEEQGLDDPKSVLAPLANYLRPRLLNSWMERRKAAFTENYQKMKRVIDNLQRKLDEAFLNIQLYEKALDLFEDDQSISDMHSKLNNGIQVEESQDSETLSSSTRMALAKGLPGSLSTKAIGLVETLEGKDLTSQVSAETDPVSLLPKVVSLIYIQVHGKALQAPGRAISVAVSRLKV